MSPKGQWFTRNQRRVASVAFSWKRAGVGGAVIALKGTVAEAEKWISIMGRRNFLTSTFKCPKFVADSRTHAIGFTASGIAVIQFEPSRIPPGRHLRFYQREDLKVTSTKEGPFTAIYVGDELFQVGHADAEALRDILGR
ncbi:MAG: hypothetical protein HGA51_00510 [Demequinaceae bacterium]|nr:hypothetical protein [Demequinaceae bacterium]